MKYVSYSLTSILACATPALTLASSHAAAGQNAAIQAASFVDKFNQIILFPLIALLSAVAFLVFIWGCAQYLIGAANDQARQQGVKHITFGIIGLVVMLSAFAILSIAASTFGLSDELECANDPSGSGCATIFQTSEPGIPTPAPTSEPGIPTPAPTSEPGIPTPAPQNPFGNQR